MSADLRGLVSQLQTRLDGMEAVLGSIADAIVWVNSDHRVQGCNAAFDYLVNHPHEAVLNAELSEVLPLMHRGQTVSPTDYPTERVLRGNYTTTQYTFQAGHLPRGLEITANLAGSTATQRTIVLTIRDVTGFDQVTLRAAASQASIDGVSDRNRIETECKQREEALRLTQEQLRQQQEILRMVIDAVPNQIFVKDWQGRYLLANQAAADFYNTSVEDIIGQRDAELHPNPEVAERFLQENRLVIETGQELFIPEEKITTITAQDEWIQWQKRPIRLPGDQTQSVLGVGVRITERKQAEEALRESETRLRLITDSMPACISYIGADYRYQFVNQTYETWFGLSREQICGMHVRELLGETAFGVVQQHFERALAGRDHPL